MKIKDAVVDWMEPYDNSPSLYFLVDRIPNFEDTIYHKKGSLYWGEDKGFVDFYYYNGPGDGFGRRRFPIKWTDGNQVFNDVLIGPWSSRSGIMNKYFPHSIECAITDNDESWERGYTFYAGKILISKVIPFLKEILPRISLVEVEIHGGMPNNELSSEQSSIVGRSDEVEYIILLDGKDKKQLQKEGYLRKIHLNTPWSGWKHEKTADSKFLSKRH